MSELVVVVDDDPNVRGLIVNLLSDYGFETAEASCGEEALRFVRERPPDVVLLDVLMPGLSGYEVLRKLKDDFGDSVGVILISGERRESYDRVAGLLVGADDYLPKPFALDELLARVQKLVRGKRRGLPGKRRLTRRELEVLAHLVAGLDNAQIAQRLVLSPRTVTTHVEHILMKLGVHSRTQAIAMAYREGFFEGPSLRVIEGELAAAE
ncbi:MAG: response regulator transcription factor [Chloroflexi bacterium]|nr:MAG: response regulator transcription factor [Chloroflexota bacterium]TME38962.1 MAG: response regulator transcription factor [Chloroflexota bacterium]